MGTWQDILKFLIKEIPTMLQSFPFIILLIALIFCKVIKEKIRGKKRTAVAAENTEINKNLSAWILVIATIALVWVTLLLWKATAKLGEYTNEMSLATKQLVNYEKHKTTPYMDVKIKNIFFRGGYFMPAVTIRNLSDGFVSDVYCGIRIIVTESNGTKRRYGQNGIDNKWAKNLEEIVNGETYASNEVNNLPIRLFKYKEDTIKKIIEEERDFHILVRMTYQDSISKKTEYYYADYYCDYNWKEIIDTYTTYFMRLKSPPIRTKLGEEELWNKGQESWKNQEE